MNFNYWSSNYYLWRNPRSTSEYSVSDRKIPIGEQSVTLLHISHHSEPMLHGLYVIKVKMWTASLAISRTHQLTSNQPHTDFSGKGACRLWIIRWSDGNPLPNLFPERNYSLVWRTTIAISWYVLVSWGIKLAYLLSETPKRIHCMNCLSQSDRNILQFSSLASSKQAFIFQFTLISLYSVVPR